MIRDYMLENISQGSVIMSGYPRNEVFFDSDARQAVRERLELNGKRVYVYMPTYRGKVSKGKTSKSSAYLTYYLFELDKRLGEDEILYVNLHPLATDGIDFSEFKNIRKFPKEYEVYEFLNIADVLITDYSSVFFDFACTQKKIILYVPDKDNYLQDRGMYMSIDELPFEQVFDAAELLQALNSEEKNDYSQFIHEYCIYDNKDCTANLLAHIMDGKKLCHEEKVVANEKKNIAVYAGNVMMKNGITTSIKNLLANLDPAKYNIYFTFYRKLTTAPCDFFENIPKGISIFSISSPFFPTFIEKFASVLQYKANVNHVCVQKILDKMYKREIKKLFYDAPFDALIHFEGYGTNDTMPLFQHYPGKRVVFVHNDMVQEICTRKNQNAFVLKRAYQNYDSIAVVSPDLIEPTVKVGAPKEKIKVVNNVHDAKSVRKRALEPITFEKDTEVRTYNPGGIQGVLNSSGKKFITVGRFSPEKGHLRLLKAFDKFCNEYPDSQLIIIGGHGPLYNQTLKQIAGMKHWCNVTVIKSIKNPIPIVNQCDLFILPSIYEGLGLVLLEADCLGVASFSTRIVGPTRLYQGFDGYLVESSEEGILHGMHDYMAGKVHTLKLDYDQYNKRAIDEFESLFMEDKMEKMIYPAYPERNIPIVFSSNDAFVPIMATMIQSIIENASKENNYDIIILTQDISMGYERKLKSMVEGICNFSIRVINVSPYVQGYTLYTANRKDITVETYFRLLLPELLPNHNKVLYLDGDMIANADVAELFNTDISDYLLASSRDADGIGRCYKAGDTRKDYRLKTLKLKGLDDYFCAGMLLMNLDRFREELPTKKLLEFAASYPWQWHDQDVLNVLCEGKVKLVHMAWDVLRDVGNNRYMPDMLYKEFLESEKNPKIIHYGGMRKPWIYLDVERGEYFWKYAGRTPFYQEILSVFNKKEDDKKNTIQKTVDMVRNGQLGAKFILKCIKTWLWKKTHTNI